MAIIITNGCFDLFHEGHKFFLMQARNLGIRRFVEGTTIPFQGTTNRLIVCVNSDLSEAVRAKQKIRGPKYPIDNWDTRYKNVADYLESIGGSRNDVLYFKSESDLHDLIEEQMPCIIVKGPDYICKKITGDDIAPVLILDTPEPESVKQMKLKVYSL